MHRFAVTAITAINRMRVPAGLFLCAGAVLESHRLAMGVPADTFFPMRPRIVPRHPQSSSKALPGHPNAAPSGPKCAPRSPKVPQRDAKGSLKREERSTMQSPKHAWAFQIEFKGSMYTPKLPINRSSGHYVILILNQGCYWVWHLRRNLP